MLKLKGTYVPAEDVFLEVYDMYYHDYGREPCPRTYPQRDLTQTYRVMTMKYWMV